MSCFTRFLLVLVTAAVCIPGAFTSCASRSSNLFVDQRIHVEVHYFFNPVSPPSVHLATQWVIETVENSYRSLMNSGMLDFTVHRVDDPLEADIVSQYRATSPALFLVRFEKGVRKAEEIKTLWAYLDPSMVDRDKKDRFVGLLKEEIESAFGAQGTTIAPATAANKDLAKLDFRITYASTPLALDIILLPYDAGGKLIVVDAVMSFKLWEKPAVFIDEKGTLLQEWQNIPVGPADLAESIGLTIRLPYTAYQPAPGAWAFLRLELLVDGVSYPVEKSLMIRPLRC